ncbi:YdcF family protein [Capilliphycus salinus ALCB114379]|uniref:YdcF family protein n=1 Tax=Capilliphycus salinus TaxID=2768948 RepID=UPI0039A642B4
MNWFQRKKLPNHWMIWAGSILLLFPISIIPVQLAIAHYQAPQPQAIFTLGGGSDRELFTAQFAKNHPDLDIWVSSGIPPEPAMDIFRAAKIPERRVHLDYLAVDTVTNFTSMVGEFKQRNIQHIYLITSDFHLPRSQAIATIVLGSQGITFTPVAVASRQQKESSLRIWRDVGRSILWVVTGRTGASLNPRVAVTPRFKSIHPGNPDPSYFQG